MDDRLLLTSNHILLSTLYHTLTHTGHALHAWRLTPSGTCRASDWDYSGPDAFPTPKIISRFPETDEVVSSAISEAPSTDQPAAAFNSDSSVQDERQWLQPAMDWLMDALQRE